MKPLITVALALATIFASTFLILTATGLLTGEGIKTGLNAASEVNVIYIILGVVALLFADIFIAVPTLTVAILSGYFLGFGLGAFSTTVGMVLAGANRMPFSRFLICYLISTLPYASIAAFAGARSSLQNPQPAIYAAIGLSLFFWIAWITVLRRTRNLPC